MLLTPENRQYVLVAATRPVEDFTTKEHKSNDQGQKLYQFQVLAIGEQNPTIIRVKAPAPAKELTPGSMVNFKNLNALLYSRDGDKDARAVSFSAQAVEAIA